MQAIGYTWPRNHHHGQAIMPVAMLRRLIAGTLVGAALAAPAAALDLFGPSCLEKLTERTRVWSECTQQFSRSDNRCKGPTAQMHRRMQKCAQEGKSRAQIDAAMTQGTRIAGKRPLPDAQETVAASAPAQNDKQSTGTEVLNRFRQQDDGQE